MCEFVCSFMYLVKVTEFPEEHQQLLMELDLLAGMRQIRLHQRVIQQSTDPSQDKMKVLQSKRIKEGQLTFAFTSTPSETTRRTLSLSLMQLHHNSLV